MRTEEEVRELTEMYMREYEGGIDPFNGLDHEPKHVPQEDICLWCVRLRLLKWILCEEAEPDNGKGMMMWGHRRVGDG